MTKFVLIFLPLLLFLVPVKAQDISAYISVREDFFVFDQGIIQKIEHLPIVNYKVGYKYIAYTDKTGEFKIYYKGISRPLNETQPTYYTITRDFVLYHVNNNLKIIYKGQPATLLLNNTTHYVMSDSLVAFANTSGGFSYFFDGKIYEGEFHLPKRWKAYENTLAYINHVNELKMIIGNQQPLLIESVEPLSFEAGGEVLAYVDQYNQFVIFYDGAYHEVDYFTPTSYKTGNRIVAYEDNAGNFKVFYKGEIIELMNYLPAFYEIDGDLLIYSDDQRYFYAFYKGKKYQLETFVPEEIKMDNNVLVYTDLDGKLKGLLDGKQEKISNQIVGKNFRIDGKVIRYVTNGNDIHFFSNGISVSGTQ